MSFPTDEELAERYKHIYENKDLQDVVHARTPNEAEPVDEEALLKFAQETAEDHSKYLDNVMTSIEQEGFTP